MATTIAELTGDTTMGSTLYVSHLPSGDVYAVEVGQDGHIVRAIGPMYYADVADYTAAEMINNATGDATEDGDWLDVERACGRLGVGIV